jgi:hypothetical protein
MTNIRVSSSSGHRLRSACLAAILCWSFGVAAARGSVVLIELDIFTFYESDGTTPLAIGSTFYLIASDSATPSNPQSFGDAFIANSTASNEVLIASLTLNGAPFFNPSPEDGEHYQELIVDAALLTGMTHLYVRFFDYQSGLQVVGSNIYWGTTAAIDLTINSVGGFDFAEAYFDDTSATNQANFIAIPEPGTFGLVALAGLGLAALGRRNRHAKKVPGRAFLPDTKR